MRAITICQPHAHLIAIAEKWVENRDSPWNYRGPIAIHAGKSRDWLSPGDLERHPDMAFGAIVAIAELRACYGIDYIYQCASEGLPAYQRILDHRHAQGPFCLILEDIESLEDPIPCRGQRGPWIVPESILEQIMAARKRKAKDKTAVVACRACGRDATYAAMKFAEESGWTDFEDAPSADGAVNAWGRCPVCAQAGDAGDEAPQSEEAAKPEDDWPSLVRGADARVESAEKDLQKATSKLETAKAAVKSAQKRVGRAVAELRDVIRARKEPFLPGMAPKADDEPKDDDAWRAVDIGLLAQHGLPRSVIEKFQGEGLKTLGDAQDWLTAKQGRTFQDLPGIGASKLEKIEAAYEKFWASWAAKKAAATPPDAESADDAPPETDSKETSEAA